MSKSTDRDSNSGQLTSHYTLIEVHLICYKKRKLYSISVSGEVSVNDEV